MYSGRKINGKCKVEEGTSFNSFQVYYLFFLTVFGKSLSTTDPQPALTCHGGVAPSLTGVAAKRLIIASGGLVEELL